MHLVDVPVGAMLSNAIVGANIPSAVEVWRLNHV
jgi:hypothetical protein